MKKKNMKNFTVTVIAAAVLSAAVLNGCSAIGQAPVIASEEITSLTDTSADTKDSKTTGNRLEEIMKKGYIEVATEPYFAPYEFIDPAKQGDDKYVGADIEFAKYIADKLGVECRIVPLEFEAVLTGITEGKYDMALSALAYTPARAEAMELSDGYFFTDETVSYGMMVRKEDLESIRTPEDLADRVVVAQNGSLQEMFAKDQIPACKELKRTSATTDGFLMVQEGKADVVVTEKTTAQLYIDANSDCDMIIVPDFSFKIDESTQGTRIGMPKGETALCDRVNEIIDQIMEEGLFNKWHEDYQEYARGLGL